jgi:transposase
MVDLKSEFAIEVMPAADAARRRPWSDADKLRIVAASFSGPRLGSATARANGISRSLLTTWRRQFREGRLGGDQGASFAPVVVTPEPTSPVETRPVADRIEIVLANGRRLIVSAGIDAAALARVVSALEQA